MIDLIAQIVRHPFHSPGQIGIGVGHVDAHPPGKVAEIPDVGMPGMRNGLSLLIVGQETECRSRVDRRVTIGQIYPHLETCGKDRWILCAGFSEMLQVLYPTDAPQLIVDQIGRGQSVLVTADGLTRDVMPMLQPLV